MSNQGTAFPVFIKAQYDPGNAKNQFVADVDEMLATADRRAGRFGERMQQRLDAAFKAPRTASGGLDIDAEGAQRAATAQSARAVAAREIAEALSRAALAENDNSLAMKQSLRAAQELATKEEQRAADLTAQARISGLVQAELNKQTSAVEMLTAATGRQNAANDNLGGGMRAQRAAMVNAGQQLQDMAVQFQMGTKASTIMAQQLPQLSFALSGLAGNANKSLAAIGGAASYMAGPWGAAIMAATVVLGPLIGRLFDTAEAADSVKFASSAMGDAQGILGGVLDMTTGKINNQSTALMALAEAQLLVARVEATTRAAEARRGVMAIQNRPIEFTGGGLGGGFSAARRPIDARDTISQQVLDGTISGKLAVERLDNLRKVGAITDEQFAAAATSVANLGVELENINLYGQAEKLLNGQGGRELLKRDRGGSRKRDGGESDAEKARKEAEQQAEAIRKIGDEQARALELATLTANGREDEAADLQLAWRLMDALNVKDRTGLEIALERVGVRRDEYEAMRGNLRTLREIEEASRVAQERMAAYLDATRSARQEVAAIFTGNGSFAGFNNIFKQLRGQYLSQQLFGDAFDGLERWLRDQSGLGRSVDYMGIQTTRAGDEAKGLATDLSAARRAITGKPAPAGSMAFEAAFAPLFGGDSGGALVKSSGETTDEIRVLGRKVDKVGANLRPEEWARELSDAMAKALGQAAPGIFGGRAAQGILGGAMYGNMVGGAPGAILGGLGGIPGLPAGLADLFSSGLQGLSGASLITDIAASFGIKVPTSAKYGILPGLIGKLFHSAKYGNASFSNGVLNVNGNNADLKASASTFGDGLLSTLTGIADQLDATLGAFSVSLGQTDGKWRISTTGRTGELKSKYSDVQVFGTGDAAYQQALAAAIRDAISDGAISGISQAAQNILKAGGDLQRAIEKAALVQSIPRQLKQLTDPVGYAIDELNREFNKVVDALKLGSASAAEFADAERLYTLKRAEAVKQASEALTGSLRSLFEELTIGNSSLSLRDRESAAMAKYGALADRVRAGDTTAYGDYADAARVMLDLERQIHGSQEAYFAALGNVTSLTRSTLDTQQALIDAAGSSANPFSANAIAANDNQGVIDGLASIAAGVQATNQNLGLILARLSGGGSDFTAFNFASNY